MKKFDGFSENETFTRLPDSFFHQILNDIDDLAELKVTLYVFWRIEHTEGAFRNICRSEIEADEHFMRGITPEALSRGLDAAVRRGSLLRVENDSGGFYFLNSPRGRAAAEALAKGDWRSAARSASAPQPRPNIFKLYEENIGPLTPLVADALKDAEREYPPDWIADALGEAVMRNKRNWKYIEAILKRWKQDGRYEGKNRKDAGESSERYSKSAFSEYIEPD
ncbi:MAG: DnaD domain protein [Anaerolineales bacterium]